MKKFKFFLATASAAFLGITAANAQTAATPKFAADDAAYCAATFGWILEFLAPNGLPEEAAMQSNIAFMMWNYELNTAMGESDEAAFKAKADQAIQKLAASMPNQGESKEEMQAIITHVTSEASACGKKLENAYPSRSHPVITALQEQAAAVRAAQAAEAAESEAQE